MALCIGCFFVLLNVESVNAAPNSQETTIQITETIEDVDTLYNRYSDNSFELLTKEYKDNNITGIKETFINLTGTVKNFIWGLVKGLGQFNASMVKYLFQLDIVSHIKKPFLSMTSSIATNMLSIAGTIGISFVAVLMVIRAIGEQRFKQAIRVFAMTILIFVGLVTLKDAHTSDSFFTTLFEIDQTVEMNFVKVNPVLNDSDSLTIEESEEGAEKRISDAGDLLAARIFFSNVYEPYLLMNYGTTNMETIREQPIEYEGEAYDRINFLLDNDVDVEGNEELHQAVADYEAEELENKTIMYFNNLKNMTFALFYLVVNLIQTIVYFILCFLRVVVAFLQVLFLPLMPFLLLVGLFMPSINVFTNYFKGFGMTIFFKAMIGFACIFFTSYLSLGFQLSSAIDDPWQKILTILIYLLVPLGLYIFRTFIGALFTNRVSLSDALAVATNPMKAQQAMRKHNKERRQEQKRQRQQEKARKAAQLQERQKKAELEGQRELGLKQANANQPPKQSFLRRERQLQNKHQQPNAMQRMQSAVAKQHEQAKTQESKEREQLRDTTQVISQERARMRAVKQTEEAVKTANQTWKDKQKQEHPSQSTSSQVRRMGAFSRKLAEMKQANRRKQPNQASAQRKQGTATRRSNQQKNELNKPSNRSVHRHTKKRPSGQLQQRQGWNGTSMHAHRPQKVRAKMRAVQQVIEHQNSHVQQPVPTSKNQSIKMNMPQKDTQTTTRRQHHARRGRKLAINKQTLIRRQVKQKEGNR